MAILIEKEKKLITIHTKHTTYQMTVGRYGHLLHLYYGKRCGGDMRYLLQFYDRGFSGNPYDAGKDRTYSLDVLPQEYPCFGSGDFRSPALILEDEKGVCCTDLKVVDCEIKKGKYGLPGLPAAYDETGEEAETLLIYLRDETSGVCVTLYYGVFEETDIISRAARICNSGRTEAVLKKAASCAVDYMEAGYEAVHFYGRYGMERMTEKVPLSHGTQVVCSRRGISGHQQNPFLILAKKGTSEDFGTCYGYSLLYSGNFKAEAELDSYDQTRCLLGISDELFAWKLAPGEDFFTPEVLMSCSGEGFGKLSHNFHRILREHVCRGAYRDARRPVLINNWEATYFDFTGDALTGIAAAAAELGVELFVLDDGWFGKRDSDESGLGDWFVNEEKLGGTLKDIADKVRGLGMKFGLWIEPEMVSEDSSLYRQHPDWAFTIPGRKPVRGRYQLVLDFSRKEITDAVFSQIANVIDQTGIDYLKIDMNRSITDVYCAEWEQQNYGATLHRYVLGMYAFLERLKLRYPQMLLEGCCGGGGRFDGGMLYYVPQIWCSDNTDAVERLKIQYGTSYGYPVSAVASHVSAVPNHQTGRITPFHTRGCVAMAGSFGYELDLKLISEAEKQMVTRQIEVYKTYWKLFCKGNCYRLSDPFGEQGYAAWEFADAEGSEALLTIVSLTSACNPPVAYVRLKGLKEDGLYRMEAVGETAGAAEADAGMQYAGGALMCAGFPVPRAAQEYQAWQFHLMLLT